MTIKTDQELIECYNLGWEDCADGNKEKAFKSKALQTAYNIGWSDFIVGDDVSSVDIQKKEDILLRIKKVNESI